MKIDEVLDEHEKIPDIQNFDNPELEGGVLVGELHSAIGELDIYKHIDDSEIMFIITKKNKESIGYMGIKPVDSYYQVKHAFIKKEFRNNGIMRLLYQKVVRGLGFKLLSDIEMTLSAEKLWSDIINGKLNVSIYDLKTKKIFTIDSAGKVKTDDGEFVRDPFKDDRFSEEQRFVFLAEGIEKYNELGEHVDRTNLRESSKFIQPYIYFWSSPTIITYEK